jgi:hypothetical protein
VLPCVKKKKANVAVLGAVIPVPAVVVLNLAIKVKAPSFHYERFIAQFAI